MRYRKNVSEIIFKHNIRDERQFFTCVTVKALVKKYVVLFYFLQASVAGASET